MSIVLISSTRTNTQYWNTGISVCASLLWTLQYGVKNQWQSGTRTTGFWVSCRTEARKGQLLSSWWKSEDDDTTCVSWCVSMINLSSDSLVVIMLTIHHQCVMISRLFSGLMRQEEDYFLSEQRLSWSVSIQRWICSHVQPREYWHIYGSGDTGSVLLLCVDELGRLTFPIGAEPLANLVYLRHTEPFFLIREKKRPDWFVCCGHHYNSSRKTKPSTCWRSQLNSYDAAVQSITPNFSFSPS